MFPPFMPPKWEYQFVRARWGGGVTRPKKNFFAFLHDSEDVLILIFESGKNCRNGRLRSPKWENSHLFFFIFNEPFPNGKIKGFIKVSEYKTKWKSTTSCLNRHLESRHQDIMEQFSRQRVEQEFKETEKRMKSKREKEIKRKKKNMKNMKVDRLD